MPVSSSAPWPGCRTTSCATASCRSRRTRSIRTAGSRRTSTWPPPEAAGLYGLAMAGSERASWWSGGRRRLLPRLSAPGTATSSRPVPASLVGALLEPPDLGGPAGRCRVHARGPGGCARRVLCAWRGRRLLPSGGRPADPSRVRRRQPRVAPAIRPGDTAVDPVARPGAEILPLRELFEPEPGPRTHPGLDTDRSAWLLDYVGARPGHRVYLSEPADTSLRSGDRETASARGQPGSPRRRSGASPVLPRSDQLLVEWPTMLDAYLPDSAARSSSSREDQDSALSGAPRGLPARGGVPWPAGGLGGRDHPDPRARRDRAAGRRRPRVAPSGSSSCCREYELTA